MSGPYAEAARIYWANSLPNPIPVRGKRIPAAGFTGYEGASVTFTDLNAWIEGPEAAHNIALRMAGTVGIDVDAHDGEHGNETMTRACARLGDLPPTWSSTSRGPGESRILIYKLPVGCGDLNRELEYAEKHMVREFGPNVEILHRGHRYAIVWPSIHPETGQQYRWYRPNGEPSAEPPKMRDLAELPITWWEFFTQPPIDQVTERPERPEERPEHTSSLFGAPAKITTNTKSLEDAAALLIRECEAFTALTTGGNGRTQKLNNLALLAGHGVPDFWTHEAAEETLLAAARESGYTGDHGERTALVQIQRGLADGARNPWQKIDVTYTRELAPEPLKPPTGDEVEALLAEMLSADQMQERPAPQYLIKGLLNLDSEAWTIGEPGCKKSFVVLDQAVHIVRGMPWRGLKVTQGPVVMIVAEGAGGMSTRVKAWQQRYGRIGEGLHMLPRPVQASNRAAWAVLAAACARLGAVMVVIDTQARVTVGLKENDATDMGLYVEAVRILRETTKACINTIHHTGRNGGDARGSSAIDGAQGTELKVVRTGPYTGVLKVEKQKDMEERPDMALTFDRVVVGQDEDGDDITSLVLVESDAFREAAGEEEPEPWETQHGDAQVKILKVLRDQGGSRGLTKSEVKGAVTERFFGNDAKRLPRQTFYTAWTKVLEKVSPEGDSVVTNAGGQRWALDPLAFESLKSE